MPAIVGLTSFGTTESDQVCHFEVYQTDVKYTEPKEQQKHEATWSLIIKQHKFKAVQHHSERIILTPTKLFQHIVGILSKETGAASVRN